MDKLLKALNNFCFGQYSVRAKLARFDKKIVKEVREREGEVGKVRKMVVEGEKSVRLLGREEEGRKKVGEAKEGREGEVRVGSVVVRVGGKARMVEGEGGSATVKEMGRRDVGMDMDTAPKKIVRRYRPCEEDLNSAMRGLVGTVLYGESIPLIQNIVEDVAGFKDIDIIPLGADKVFVQSLSGVSVSDIVGEAKQFFDLIFSSLVRWNKGLMPFQRSA